MSLTLAEVAKYPCRHGCMARCIAGIKVHGKAFPKYNISGRPLTLHMILQHTYFYSHAIFPERLFYRHKIQITTGILSIFIPLCCYRFISTSIKFFQLQLLYITVSIYPLRFAASAPFSITINIVSLLLT